MALRVSVAGVVELEVDGAEVDLSSLGRVGRHFWVYLVCERHRPVAKDELADVLWGEDLPRSWDQMLRGNASKLRAILAGAGLEPAVALKSAFGAYQLVLPPDAVVDVEEAASALEGAGAALDAGGDADEAYRAASRSVCGRGTRLSRRLARNLGRAAAVRAARPSGEGSGAGVPGGGQPPAGGGKRWPQPRRRWPSSRSGSRRTSC